MNTPKNYKMSINYVIQTRTTESKENKLKTSLIEIMRFLFNHPIHEINKFIAIVK